MSFLMPLYIAGLAALALPVLFHLIRRTPRGEIPFSALMFLSPSPPRITRRSRLEHWLLLLLRAAALALLALAFSRPFWREAGALTQTAPDRRIAIVVDSSASMRRDDLWQQAVRTVGQVLANLRPQDEVAVYTADESLEPLAGFEDLARVQPHQRRAVVDSRLAATQPSWRATRLGQVLTDAAAALNDGLGADDVARRARRIVLVSDMQHGSRLEALGDFPWPADVELELHPVAAKTPTNAGLARLADDPEDAAAAESRGAFRIRVANSAGATRDQFTLQWTAPDDIDAGGDAPTAATPAFVPPGESRVVRVPAPPKGLDRPQLILAGDDHDFDNRLFVVPRDRRKMLVAYLGRDQPQDPEGLRYYLEQAFASQPANDLAVVDGAPLAAAAEKPVEQPDEHPDRLVLAVVTSPPSDEHLAALLRYAEQGGAVLATLTDAREASWAARLLDVPSLDAEEAEPAGGYAMLGEIDFRHPLFAGMAAPSFNDFTNIHFWKYRRLTLPDDELPDNESLRIIARFENGDPAVVERSVGQGRILLLAAGWHPRDSQLARSWKFLAMLYALLDGGPDARRTQIDERVGRPVALPESAELGPDAVVITPDGARVPLARDARSFVPTRPGLHTLETLRGLQVFAVNLDPLESDVAPLGPDAFEQAGARLVGAASEAAAQKRLAQLKDIELESRQRIWQWLAAAAFVLLIAETAIAGGIARRQPAMDSSRPPSAPAPAA